jgi:putative transposase
MDISDKYKGYRTPKSIIGYAVRNYYRYKLSLRDISEMLLNRGLEVSYETIRKWCKSWGPYMPEVYVRKGGLPLKTSGMLM